MNLAATHPARPRPGSRRLLRYGGLLLTGVLGLGMLQATPAFAATPSLAVKNVRVTEVDTGATTAVARVVLSDPAPGRVTVQYRTVNRTARAGLDYVAQSGRVVIPRGQRVARISVPVLGDRLDEGDEAFAVRISRPVGATVADAVGLVRILDDDPLPVVGVGDVTVAERDSGAVVARFPLTLSAVTGRPVRVSYAITGGSATDGTDFVVAEPTGVVELPAGTTTRSVGIAVLGDLLDENDETVYLSLSAPVNALLPDSTGVATIHDDDDLSLSVDDVTVVEGVTASFAVRLSRATNQPVTFGYTTSNGSAVAGSDYTATSGTRVIPAGSTATTISVPTSNDTVTEETETFSLVLSGAVNASIKDGLGVATITDNDGPSLRVGDVAVVEGGVAYVPVTLSAALTKDVTFGWSTSSGTAGTSDYVAASGTGTIKARSTSTTVAVWTRQDTLIEADEVFYVSIFNPANASVADAEGAVTVRDDDAPVISIGDVTVDEGARAWFEVRLSSPAVHHVSFDWATVNGTATGGTDKTRDYTTSGGNDVVIPVGQTSVLLSVSTTADTVDEYDETFFVNLSDIRNAQLGDGQARVLILDDDDPPSLAFVDSTVDADEDQDVVFTVRLSAVSAKPVTVRWSTANGPTVGGAVAGQDYTPVTAALVTIPAGSTDGTITVRTVDDKDDEVDETFSVTLFDATNATIPTGQAQGTATILDNDPAPK